MSEERGLSWSSSQGGHRDSGTFSPLAGGRGSCVSGGWGHSQFWVLCGWGRCCKWSGGTRIRHQWSFQLCSPRTAGSCSCSQCSFCTTQWRICQDALSGATVKGAHDGWGGSSLLQLAEEVELSLPVLWCWSGEIQCCSTSQQRCHWWTVAVVGHVSTEDNNNLFGLTHIQEETIILAQRGELADLLPKVSLIVIGDETYCCCDNLKYDSIMIKWHNTGLSCNKHCWTQLRNPASRILPLNSASYVYTHLLLQILLPI